MLLNKRVVEIQDKAYSLWKKYGKKGTLEIATGVGKTFIALKAISESSPGSKVLFLAERERREHTLNEEIVKYDSVHKTNLLTDYTITFMCYQSAYKLKNTEWDLVIGDEIHECGMEYTKFFHNNKYKALMCLTATATNNSKYEVNNLEYNKKQFIHKFIAPILFTYTLSEGLKDGVVRKSKIYVIKHKLDSVEKNIEVSSKFKTTEKEYYTYWKKKLEEIEDARIKREIELNDYSGYTNKEKYERQRIFKIRANFLYNLPSKKKTVNNLIKNLKGKTLIFANSIKLLQSITPYTITGKEKNVSDITNAFNNGETDVMASFKVLQQGENLPVLDNVIIASYYSNHGQTIQRIGRLRRNDSEGNIFIIVTEHTQEEEWFDKIKESLEAYEFVKVPTR
jgi:superfamily II DNA or RNA helicase